MSNKPLFFAELKRRNVYKVAITYGVVAWLLLQVATQVFPFLEIPNWAIRLVIMLIVIGFPIALIIAWAFELTPEGLKRTEFADELPKKPARKRAWIYVVVIAGAISIVLFFLGRFTAAPKQRASVDLQAKSIAVLPFESLSEDKANAYFASGIQDEIITRLAKIADLKVISRTSTQRFKAAPEDLRQIAKQLGVMNILEGSVQRSADQVRVNVQLINATTDAHLWADTFDRKLTDIFTVESEIAKTIAEVLQAKLSGLEEHAISVKPTADPAAHQLYLKGRYFWNKGTGDDLKKAIDYFNQAIGTDPKYALAYAGLADAYLLLPWFSADTPQDSYPRAKAAAKTALELDETLAEAHIALAQALRVYDFDFGRASAEFRRGLELDQNNATGHWRHSSLLAVLGRFEEAIAEIKRAVELDPLSLIINSDFWRLYVVAGRYQEAIDQLHRTLEMEPDSYYAHSVLGWALECKGSFAAALAEYRTAHELNDDPYLLANLAHAYAASGNLTGGEEIPQ